MSPEAEAANLERDIKAAQASGDISTILRLFAKTSEITPSDFIKKTIGNILFIYYTYVENLHCRPEDLEDLVDGLLYLDARGFLQKKAYDEALAKARSR